MELLPGLTPSYGIYIDVGANQPTRISNTYLFYRLGYKGVVIEPNRELTGLFKRFRQRDIHLEIGCSNNSGVGNFKKTYASVGSGFADNIKPLKDVVNFVPLLTVDEIWRDTGLKNVFLLSIDTEGFDLNVLNGANDTLKNTACIIIETRYNDVNEINAILHKAGFRLVKTTDCNYIWKNEGIVKTMSKS